MGWADKVIEEIIDGDTNLCILGLMALNLMALKKGWPQFSPQASLLLLLGITWQIFTMLRCGCKCEKLRGIKGCDISCPPKNRLFV